MLLAIFLAINSFFNSEESCQCKKARNVPSMKTKIYLLKIVSTQ